MNNGVRESVFSSLSSFGHAAIPFLFSVIFLLSGIYEVPFLPLSGALITQGKQIVFVCLMALMGVSLRWRQTIREPFSLFCALWALLHAAHWAWRAEYSAVYVHRIVQICFIWLLVSLIIQQRKGSEPFLGLRSFFSPSFFPAVSLLLVFLAFHRGFAEALSNGLGNGRVSFSIWLSQLVFLTFLMEPFRSNGSSRGVLKCLLLVCPIVILQTFTGGRTGLLATLAICFYFSFREGGGRLAIVTGAYLAILVFFGATISPLPNFYPGTYIFRAMDFAQDSGAGWLDRLSSYRLGIMISALSTLDADTFLFGKGVMNFKGWAIGYPFDVHNIYVRALGEVGFFGFIVLVALLSLPFFASTQQKEIAAAKAYCVIFLLIGLVHPDLLTTAISTCMIFWLCFAEIMKNKRVLVDT